MSGKRWLALGIAFVLFLFSIGVDFLSNLAFSNLSGWEESLMASAEEPFTEEILEDGNSDKKIVVLEINGVIQDTGNVQNFLESPVYNHRAFMKMLEQAGEDRSVKGIVLRVNSPGGGVVESAEIHEKIIEIQKKTKKPVYVSMGSMAASGGYYVSAPADKIFASPETLTGSLGVIMQGVNYAEAAKKFGITFDTIKSGEHKDIMSPTKEMSEAERAILQRLINNSYDGFVQVISKGRNIPESKVREIADGRIYDGRQAKELNLIDDFGYFDDVIDGMKKDRKLSGAQIVRYQESFGFSSWLQMSAQKMFVADSEWFGLTKLLSQPSSPRPMYLYAE